MAVIIPNLSTVRRMTPGERRLGQRLETLLEDDYTVWYDIPLGHQRRYPDFIVLNPGRGLLFLEVKDWKPDIMKRIGSPGAEALYPGLKNFRHSRQLTCQCASVDFSRKNTAMAAHGCPAFPRLSHFPCVTLIKTKKI
ncbi:nuclease-related domain-containing protein [Alloalcanivorax sp. C16-1]|uniref:nuclease-related domain-containing protein n=1 Tax=Alloalcanivorax sp. C16-1 TaxID=3390051 RepID=UPI003970AAC3